MEGGGGGGTSAGRVRVLRDQGCGSQAALL